MNRQPICQISPAFVKCLPSTVRHELATLSAQQQAVVAQTFKRQSKSLRSAYLLLFSLFGPHYGYVRKWRLQTLFWLTGGGFFIWWFIDLFRLPGLIQDYNTTLIRDIVRNLASSH